MNRVNNPRCITHLSALEDSGIQTQQANDGADTCVYGSNSHSGICWGDTSPPPPLGIPLALKKIRTSTVLQQSAEFCTQRSTKEEVNEARVIGVLVQ